MKSLGLNCCYEYVWNLLRLWFSYYLCVLNYTCGYEHDMTVLQLPVLRVIAQFNLQDFVQARYCSNTRHFRFVFNRYILSGLSSSGYISRPCFLLTFATVSTICLPSEAGLYSSLRHSSNVLTTFWLHFSYDTGALDGIRMTPSKLGNLAKLYKLQTAI